MQPAILNDIIPDREEAGYLLSKSLENFRNSNAIVVGIPHGGMHVASAIAETLSLPLEVMLCRPMAHPGDRSKTIGSVSRDDIVMHDFDAIPQDYVYHQVALLRNAMAYEQKKYDQGRRPLPLRYRPVILVANVLSSADTLIACLRSIRKQNPLKIIIAVPVVAAEAARVVGAEADDLVFLRMEPSLPGSSEYFADFSDVGISEVKQLLTASEIRCALSCQQRLLINKK